jgi:hypothetical protein
MQTHAPTDERETGHRQNRRRNPLVLRQVELAPIGRKDDNADRQQSRHCGERNGSDRDIPQ